MGTNEARSSGGGDPRDDGRPRPPGPEERRGATAGGGANGEPPKPPSMWDTLKSPRFWIILLILAAVNWLLVPLLFPEPNNRATISYTFFKQQVDAGNVREITSQGDKVQGTFKTAVTPPTPPATPGAQQPAPASKVTQFETNIPTFANNDQLDQLLESKGVIIDAKPLDTGRSPLLTLLLGFGPAILLIAGFLWLTRSMTRGGAGGGGLFSLGRSRARRYNPNETQRVTFADVAGIDEVEDELIEIVDFLKQPAKYQRLGGTIPKGVLLVGAPGTGKTLLARAVAGEAHVPFFSMSGSEFVEMVVGVGASRVRDLFAQAKQAAPAIVFVDELDAIGRKRGSSNFVGSNDEREQTLNQLLVEMDGFDARQAVIVLAATNRADVLDPALLRPGRFDRRVTVQPPDKAGRAAILAVHTRGVPLAPDADLNEIAAETPGLVGADLRNLVNEAALLAARRGHNAVGMADFADALEKIALGAERKLMLEPSERERIAYHESGHALLGLLQPDGDPVRRVTVVPRGQALGVTLSVPDADRYNLSEAYLRARIVSALGGRGAEQVVYGTVTSGAENDIKQVTDLARAMVTRWGMSKEVGLLALSGTEEGNFLDTGLAIGQDRPYSDETARAIDIATRRIIDESYQKALGLLTENRVRLDSLAHALLKEETLDEQQMLDVTGLAGRPRFENPIAAER
ncbi:MAG TPA: ATP-dependent zinc metalloprotease FtsH [Thermomicrobiales bacterium]|nr:ATP-dependent zinc metalloprotease FtsH [Thermomicrobiales bacterium]